MSGRKKSLGLTLLRRSSERQELSLSMQLGWAIKAAEGMGVVLDARLTDIEHMQAQRLSEHKSIYLDDSISGANLGRPGFQAMVERAISDKRVSHVFIYKRDRFARPEEASAMVQLENQLRRKGITLVFNDKLAKPLDHGEIDQAGDVIALLEYHQSGEFLNVLAERVIAAQQLLASGGYWRVAVLPMDSDACWLMHKATSLRSYLRDAAYDKPDAMCESGQRTKKKLRYG